MPTRPACELSLTMRPAPRGTIVRATAWVTKNRPLRLTSIIASQSASVTSRASWLAPRPALLTRMSMRPRSATRRCTAGSMLARSVTSSSTATARPPATRTCSTRPVTSAAERAPAATVAPAAARARTRSCPMPREAPVTRATWSERSKVGCSIRSTLAADPMITRASGRPRKCRGARWCHGRARICDPDLLRRQRGGSVLVPAFAVDRTELVLQALSDMVRDGEIPVVPVHVDSPMALAALEVYRRGSLLDELRAGIEPEFVHLPTLKAARTAEESMALNSPKTPCIIISASVMASGGRVVHHLRHMLPDHRNTVVLTGYQAIGTRGRALLDGARELKMFGRYVPVSAEVVADEEFSVHADADEILGWLRQMPQPPETVYVVHGERGASEGLASASAPSWAGPWPCRTWGSASGWSEAQSADAAPGPCRAGGRVIGTRSRAPIP